MCKGAWWLEDLGSGIPRPELRSRRLKLTFTKHSDYDEDGRYLKTDRGLLRLNCTLAGGSPYQEQSIFTGQNLLWLLPDYRANCSAFFNDVLALGHVSGQVTFLEFDLSEPVR
jgi:hypothetical protein